MRPKRLQWRCSSEPTFIWIGTLTDNFHVRFELHELEDNKYLMKSNLEGVRKLIIQDLDQAKLIAQEQFETYAYHLFDNQSGSLRAT